MKILLVADFYPPVIGGLEKHVAALASELVDRGNQISVITLDSQRGLSTENGIRVQRIRPLTASIPLLHREGDRPFPPPAPLPALVRAIRDEIVRFDPALVHAHGWCAYSAAKAMQGYPNVPLLATLHDYGLICPRRTLFHVSGQPCSHPTKGCISCSWPIYGLKAPAVALMVNHGRSTLDRVDRFLAVSGAVRDAYAPFLPSEKLFVVPNFLAKPVPMGALNPELPEVFFLYLGALLTEKGVDVLLRAWTSIDAQLVVIGRGTPPVGEIRNVKFLANASSDLVGAALRKARGVIIPSIWADPCPTVIFEAMSVARPVITTALGGMPEIVADGETGIVVPPNSEEALQQAVKSLLLHPQLTEQMGEAGRDRYQRLFSAEQVVPRIVAHYESVLRGRISAREPRGNELTTRRS